MSNVMFCGNYIANFPENEWSMFNSYSDLINSIVYRSCSNAIMVYDDNDGRRGYFTHNGIEYTIRTWNICETSTGATVEYSIYN